MFIHFSNYKYTFCYFIKVTQSHYINSKYNKLDYEKLTCFLFGNRLNHLCIDDLVILEILS